MAQLWENTANLTEEHEVAAMVAQKWKCRMFKLPIQYRDDFAAVRDGKVVALVEVRCRNKKYETFMFSVQKRAMVRLYSKDMNVPAYMVVKYPDGLFYFDLEESPDSVEIGGRNDVRDSRDIEMVYHYDIERLLQL